MYERYTWKDEVVVSLNERALRASWKVKIFAVFTPESPLMKGHFERNLKKMNKPRRIRIKKEERVIFWTNGHSDGRTGRGAASAACES